MFVPFEKLADLIISLLGLFGILRTPGLVIDGKLIATGKLLQPDEIMSHLR
jgi:hypothetical protein